MLAAEPDSMLCKLVTDCRMREIRPKVLCKKSGADFWNLPKPFVKLLEAMEGGLAHSRMSVEGVL
jgi:hypothetical protein